MTPPAAAPPHPASPFRRDRFALAARFLPHLLALVVVGVCIARAAPLAERFRLISYPYAIDQEEEWLLVHLRHVLAGRSPIRPLDESFVVATYHPLMLLLTAPLARADDPSLAPGRAIAAAAACLAAISLALVTGLLARSPAFGAAAGLLWLLSRDTLSWLPYFRVDFLALQMGWLAMACFAGTMLRPPREGARLDLRRVALVAAGALGVLAFFAKQTMIAPLAAMGIVLLWSDPRRGALWCGAVAAAIAAGMALLEATSPGSYWFHAITANANVFSGWQLRRWATHFYRFHVVLLGAVVLCVPLAVWWGRRGGRGEPAPPPHDRARLFERAVLVYAGLALLSFLGAAKLGAAENYMLEPNGALLLLLAWAQGRLHAAARRSSERLPPTDAIADESPHLTSPPPLALDRLLAVLVAAAPAFLLLAHAEASFARPWFARQLDAPMVTLGLKTPSLADFRAAERATQWTAQRPDASYVERPLLALRAGAPVMLHPFIMAQLAREGKWDEGALFDRWDRDPPWQLVITTDLRDRAPLAADAPFTPRFKAWLNDHYQLEEFAPAPLFTYYRWTRRAQPSPDNVAAPAAPHDVPAGPPPAPAPRLAPTDAPRAAELREVRLTPSEGGTER